MNALYMMHSDRLKYVVKDTIKVLTTGEIPLYDPRLVLEELLKRLQAAEDRIRSLEGDQADAS